jgi:putative ABC transport system permease protein
LTRSEVATLYGLDNEADPLAVVAKLGQRHSFRVTGIGVTADAVAFDQGFEPLPIIGTRAYWNRFGRPSAGFWAAMVALRRGYTADHLRRELAALHPDEPFAVQSLDATRSQALRAIQPQVVALWVFAGITLFVALLVVGQAVSRRLSADSIDHPTLDALGATRVDRFASSMLQMTAVGVGGAVLAVVSAFLLSPIGPVGPARLAEPAPGFEADWWVLALGGLCVAVTTIVVSVWSAWRSSRVTRTAEAARSSRPATWMAGAGASVAAVIGVRFAFDTGSRRRPIPARATMVSAATAVTVVVAVITFAASLDHLVSTPRLYGFPGTFLVNIDGGSDPATSRALIASIPKRLAANPNISRVSTVHVSEVALNGKSTPAIAFEDGPRPVEPVLRDGRYPRRDTEVALGASTMDDFGVRLGDTVRLGPRGHERRATVVGTAVLPAMGTYPGADKAGLGLGMLLTPQALFRYGADFDKWSFIVATPADTSLATLTASVHSLSFPTGIDAIVTSAPAPSDIVALRRLRSTPFALGAILVLLIAATVIHALALAVRRRRHDVAVLQTVGMRPGQIVRSSLWQAAAIGLVAVVCGIPLGIIAGRWSWLALAGVLGVFEESQLPVLAITIAGASVLAAALVSGLVPGWRASRRRPAIALRTE